MNPPTPAGASLRSALVPGWGQWAAGRRGRGLLLLAVATLALLLPLAVLLALLYPLLPVLPLGLPEGLVRALAGAGEALTVLVPPLEGLLGGADWAVLGQVVLAANVVVLLFRGVAALDAARCARRPSGHRTGPAVRKGGLPGLSGPLSLALGALAAFLVLAPHALFTGAALAAQPVLTQVLQPPPPAPVPAPAGPAPEPTPSDPFAAVLPQLPPPDAARPVWDGKSALNVLLLGTDRRPRDVSMGQWGNSDTILLVSLDPTRQQAAMVSVPRDLLIENIPGVGQEKVNAAYRRGGPDLAVRVVGDLLGVPIHRWASIDTSAFATMIDALGGVVVDVERPIRDDEFPNEDYSVRRILIPSGLQWLDGERALWYARSRHGSNDFDRAERQQRLLLSLKGRARDPTVVPRLPGMVLSLADAVSTDVSPREALTLASLGVKTDFKTVRGLVLTPPAYGAILNRPDLFAVVPNRQRIRRDVAALLSAEASPSSPSPSPIAGRPLTPLPVEPDPETPGPAAPPAP
jgi:LCP family protein required for cell wall assembly